MVVAALWIQFWYFMVYVLLKTLHNKNKISIYTFWMFIVIVKFTFGMHLKHILYRQILLYVTQVRAVESLD